MFKEEFRAGNAGKIESANSNPALSAKIKQNPLIFSGFYLFNQLRGMFREKKLYFFYLVIFNYKNTF